MTITIEIIRDYLEGKFEDPQNFLDIACPGWETKEGRDILPLFLSLQGVAGLGKVPQNARDVLAKKYNSWHDKIKNGMPGLWYATRTWRNTESFGEDWIAIPCHEDNRVADGRPMVKKSNGRRFTEDEVFCLQNGKLED